MAFCIPVSIDRIGRSPDGSLVVEGKQICWGKDVPPPPVPVPAPELPGPETGSGVETGVGAGPRTGTGTETGATTKEDTCTKNCPKCEARTLGSSYMRYYGAVTAGAMRGYAYQHYVCPWHRHMPHAMTIEEWRFGAVEFDGLHPANCHLYEAKHGYDGFLVQNEWGIGGVPELQDWAERAKIQNSVFSPMIREGANQHFQVSPYYGEVSLTWVFSHMITRLYVGRLLLDTVPGWYHEMEVRPFLGG